MSASLAGQALDSSERGTSDLEAHYRTLQLSPDADLELVERAYWLLAFRYHDQGQREALQQLNEAMSAVVSALAREGAARGRPTETTEERPGILSTLAWELGWLAATASAVSLGLGLALGAVEAEGRLRALEDWQGVMVGGGAAGLGALAAIAALASLAPAVGRALASRAPRLTGLPDYYQVLHLDPLASAEVVELAYAHLSKKYSLAGAGERVLAVEEAYRVLSDPQLRASYDAQRAMARAAVPQRPLAPPVAAPPERPPRAAPAPAPAEAAPARPRERRPRQVPAVLPALARAAAEAARWGATALGATARALWRAWQKLWPVLVRATVTGIRAAARGARSLAGALASRRQARAAALPPPAPPAAPPRAQSTSPGLERLLQVRGRTVVGPPQGTLTESAAPPQAAAPPTARLVVLEGPMAGRSFELRPDAAITLGTDPDCEIVLEAPSGALPPQLARIWPREDRFMLHLLAPEVPATIQGRPLVWVVLEDGDLLELGPYRLRFEVVRQRT
ncbi:Chaperone protein DnaJ [bacterium HR24]|nr:Chaperone protein DnaJ [bacterium HR24]